MKNSILMFIILLNVFTFGKNDLCKDIKDKDRMKTAKDIMNTFHVYKYCDKVISECLEQDNKKGVSKILRDYVCRLIKQGKSKKYIMDALTRRAHTMVDVGDKALLTYKNVPFVGKENAFVELTVFLCAKCPYCRIVVPDMYKCIKEGKLKNKVRMYIKLFPIRSHKGSAEGGFAFETAYRMGAFWRYMHKTYEKFTGLENDDDWIRLANETGLDTNEFKKIYFSEDVKQSVVESKKQGILNDVNATPTIFINKRKYFADMDIQTIVDIVDEEINAE